MKRALVLLGISLFVIVGTTLISAGARRPDPA